MLSQILFLINEFESRQGCRPAAVRLSARHMLELMDEWAERFDREPPLTLGVRLVVVRDAEAPQPQALARPASARNHPAAALDADVALAWTPNPQNGG